jgi:hypothetical protein
LVSSIATMTSWGLSFGAREQADATSCIKMSSR